MYSAYLFFAFIFGRTLLVESTGYAIDEDTGTTMDTIGFKVTTGAMSASTQVQLFTTNAAATNGQEASKKMVANDQPTTTDNDLTAGTQYYFWVYETTGGSEGYLNTAPKGPYATLPKVPVVTFSSADSTSATYKWTNYKDDYETDKAKAVADPGTTTTATAEEVVLSGLTAATLTKITFTGEKHSKTNTKEVNLCTAPTKPTVTHEVKAETNGDNTLTVKIEFAATDKVSEIEITLAEDISTATAACDTTECADCAKCSAVDPVTGDKGYKVTPETVAAGGKYNVIVSKYPTATLQPDFKVAARFREGCTIGTDDIGESIYDLKSFAALANTKPMLVYLSIGAMATVLRLLGLEVWTPLGSH